MLASLHTLHLNEPFRIAHGTSAARQVLRLRDGGRTAEAPFVPYYGEVPEETLEVLKQTPLPESLPRTASLALNLLQHDLTCQSTGLPLSSLAIAALGSPDHAAPPGCRSFSIPDDLEIFHDKVREIGRQFRVLKLKLGSGDLGLDLAIVAVARRAAPHAELLLDVNGGWEPSESPMMIQKLMENRPALIEQPFHHRHGPEAWKTLQAELPEHVPPLFADESVQTAADVVALAPWVDGVNIKLLKSGSFEEAVKLIALAKEHGLQILLGCMIESSLGTTAAAHLAPWADWIDLDGHFYVANDDFTGIEYDDHGALLIPDRPGIGAIPR